MHTPVIFKIDRTEFVAELDLGHLNRFVVQSVPKPYLVQWQENMDPVLAVMQALNENAGNLLLIDRNVFDLYLGRHAIDGRRIFLADAVEDFKTLHGVIKVIDFLASRRFTKGERLVVVGGGIIQDVGAFVSACYKRGIPWVYFPTTLLSMCDSCIGGKTGINHNQAKNQLALFSAPSEVIINHLFLKTLQPREIISGLGEVVKLHITGGRRFLDVCRKHVGGAMTMQLESFKPLILYSLGIKRAVVEQDEFEINHRRFLNYGHTIGHAIEILTRYGIPHGQAITYGMIVANELSAKYGRLTLSERDELETLLYPLVMPGQVSGLNADRLLDLLCQDKKAVGKRLYFAVVNAIGDNGFLPLEMNNHLAVELLAIIDRKFKQA